MNITTLAQDIKDIATEILELDYKVNQNLIDIAEIKKDIELSKLPIERDILSNPEYKNEAQRKNAILERISSDEDIKASELEIYSKESFISDTEMDIKKLKIEKNYKETILKLEFIKLEKGV